MSSIASKNLYELLGNDPDQDPDREPEPPTKAIDKPAARTGKRNGPSEAPARAGGASTRVPKDSGNANDNYLRDPGVGSDRNRSRAIPGDATGETYRGGRARRGVRGGRGGRAAMQGDRHSRTGIAEHDKQAAHGWGATEGEAELADEKAGEAIAQKEEKEAIAEDAAADEPEATPEPEDKTKSYTAYLAELAEKKLSLGASNVRKANEGSSKKFPEGTALARDEEDDFIAGSGGKNKRTRERKEKAFVELDGDRMLSPPQREGGFRGGRGRGRGEFRGEGRGRGGRGRGEGRGEYRGGRGGRGGQSGPNISDASAFPSLGK
jgi:plasminogen activator inhibitor 1 RNA-binding protein